MLLSKIKDRYKEIQNDLTNTKENMYMTVSAKKKRRLQHKIEGLEFVRDVNANILNTLGGKIEN